MLLALAIIIFPLVGAIQPPARLLLNDPNNLGPENRIYVAFKNITIINLKLPTIFIIHGFKENGDVWYYKEIPTQFARLGDYNVIGVDWGPLASSLYPKVSTRVPRVGKFLGNFIAALKTAGMDTDLVHVIGHSLGAHIAGFSGKHFSAKTGTKLKRITGLDPAGPGFNRLIFDNSGQRLARTDAKMVVVLHTDRGKFGIFAKIGSIDFMANGGRFIQPGCPNSKYTLEQNLYCGHQNSVRYFNESIVSNRFVGCSKHASDVLKCAGGKKVVFGSNTPFGARGVYYFNTNPQPAYAQG